MLKEKRLLIVLIILLSIMTIGMGSKKDAVTTPEKKITWPLPPLEPKIEFVRSINKPDDLGIKKGFFKKLWEVIAGESENQITKPFGIAVDDKGKLYVTDTASLSVHVFDQINGNYNVIREPERGMFVSPVGVDVDKKGNIFIADSILKRIYVFSEKGKYLRDLKPPADDLAFQRPTGIAINREAGLLYIVDTIASKVHVYTTDGQYKFSFGEEGEGDGQFNHPTFIAVTKNGELHISDTLNFRVQIFDKNGECLSKLGKQRGG